jgi:hypothetical protein
MTQDFEEIAHCGRKVTFEIQVDEGGKINFGVGFRINAPVPAVLTAIYALYPGVPVASINMGGLGDTWSPPPFSHCLPVLIASDNHGKFGHHCPRCQDYWRSGPWPHLCPYCALITPAYQFLSTAQRRYVYHYCEVLSNALSGGRPAVVEIDMDAVADAVGKEGEKPAFYVSEKSQQRKFVCSACGEFNDILGRFGFCSLCGTRNDLAEFEEQAIPHIRDRLNTAISPEDCVRDAVAAFDSQMAQIAKSLAKMVPMTKRRKSRLLKHKFHDPEEVGITFKTWFDIDVFDGMNEHEKKLVIRTFHRRHVYEHNGGEVDQTYLDDSGDTSVCLKQHIHESKEDVHHLLGMLVKMARNVHKGFHELFLPNPAPIKAFETKKSRGTNVQ